MDILFRKSSRCGWEESTADVINEFVKDYPQLTMDYLD